MGEFTEFISYRSTPWGGFSLLSIPHKLPPSPHLESWFFFFNQLKNVEVFLHDVSSGPSYFVCDLF